MDIHQLIRSRRSIRHFLDEPVSDAVIYRILETATWSASAHNRQPWRFFVLHNKSAIVHLSEVMGEKYFQDLIADQIEVDEAIKLVHRSKTRIQSAPLAVVLCMDSTEMDVYPDPIRNSSEYVMAVQSVALAGGTILLAAHAEGLGGVWMCAPLFTPEAIVNGFALPATWQPQALLLIGHPATIPTPRPRKIIDEVAIFI